MWKTWLPSRWTTGGEGVTTRILLGAGHAGRRAGGACHCATLTNFFLLLTVSSLLSTHWCSNELVATDLMVTTRELGVGKVPERRRGQFVLLLCRLLLLPLPRLISPTTSRPTAP